MIEIKNRFTLEVIFTSKKETIKEAIIEAIGQNANPRGADLNGVNLSGVDLRGVNLRAVDLRGADLSGADLNGVNLSGANLRGANLCGANLSGANLWCASLSDANLRGANLRGANLCRANLRGADLRGADLLCSGNLREIKTMQIDTYKIGFTIDTLQIGCQKHKIEDWKNFDDNEISKMDQGALEWWKKWKDFIFKAIELSK